MYTPALHWPHRARTRRRHRVMPTALPLLAAVLVCGCGSASLPDDPRAYPVQVEELRRFSPDVAWLCALPGDSAGGRLLEAHLQPPSHEYFAEISSPAGELIHQRTELAPDAPGPAAFSLLPVSQPPALRPAARPFVFHAATTAGEAALVRMTVAGGRRDTLLRVARPAGLARDDPWDISLNGPWWPDTSAAAVLVSVNYGVTPLPREIIAFDSLDARLPRFRFRSGGQLQFQGCLDGDGDGVDEWLFGSTAPCHGLSVDGLHDSTAWFIALRQDGRPLWMRSTPAGGGNSRLLARRGPRTLIGLRAYQHFLKDRQERHTVLTRLDPATGTVLATRDLPGEVVVVDGWERLLHVDLVRGRLQWLDDGLQPRGRAVRIPGAGRPVGTTLVDDRGRRLFQLGLATGDVLLLDEALSVRGRLPARLLGEEALRPPVATTSHAPFWYPATGGDGMLRLVRPVSVPWWRWWTWRHRWVLFGIGLPLLVAAAAWGVHRARLRFRTARLLEAFTQRQFALQEQERTRIARELHDELGQELVLTRLAILRAHPEAASSAHPASEWLAGLDGALASMRRLIDELRPAVLDQLGLRAALDWQLRRVTRQAGLDAALEDDGHEPELPRELETALFRIHQEALTNVVKHAGASRVRSGLWDLGDRLRLEVADDGRGLDQAGAGSGHGLTGARERLRPWQGRLSLENGQGLRLRVEIDWARVREGRP